MSIFWNALWSSLHGRWKAATFENTKNLLFFHFWNDLLSCYHQRLFSVTVVGGLAVLFQSSDVLWIALPILVHVFSHCYWLNVLYFSVWSNLGLFVYMCLSVYLCLSVNSRLPKLLARFQQNSPKWVPYRSIYIICAFVTQLIRVSVDVTAVSVSSRTWALTATAMIWFSRN